MKRWWIYIGHERREFWAVSGDDCYQAIRQETKNLTAGYQRVEGHPQ